MDEKTLTAFSTSLALFQIQLNALLLLLEREHPNAKIREEFQRLTSEGVEAVGIQTMEAIKSRIREGILQQEQEGQARMGKEWHSPAPQCVGFVGSLF